VSVAAPQMPNALRKAVCLVARAHEKTGLGHDQYKEVSDAIEKATGVKP